MANKTVTITEPVADDVIGIQIGCDGAGNVTNLSGNVRAASDDASTNHATTFQFDVSSLPAAVQTAVDNLVAECLTQFKTQREFTP